MSHLDAAQKTARDADKAELSALHNMNASIDEGLVDESISGESEDLIQTEFDEFDLEEYARQDCYNDSLQGKIREEIENRSDLLGELYPFELRYSSLHYKTSGPTGSKVYETLLRVSTASTRQGADWNSLAASFEQLSAWAIKEFFQCRKAWWTGVGSGNPFKDLVDRIHQETGELEWNPDPNFPVSASNVNDAGLDFINYRNLIDMRKGGIFYFGQSACGNDWSSKIKLDLRESRYKRFFREPYANPVKVFTIPYLLASDHEKMLKATSDLRGLVFDRSRLTRLLSSMRDDEDVAAEIGNIHALAEKCS